MHGICKNCGRLIHISIFKGGDWCSENCRKALVAREMVQRSRQKCTYEPMWGGDAVGMVDVCVIHGTNSKYHETRGEHRPCLAVEGY